jgi:hypothetical protein
MALASIKTLSHHCALKSQLLCSFQTGLETDVKRLLFLPVVLHVDTGALDALDSATRAQNIR